MDFLAPVIRNESRLRLVFSSPVAVAAFTGAGTIAISSLDAHGESPNVEARLAIVGAPANMDLVLDTELVRGGVYQLTLTGIPGADSTTVTVSQQFAYPDDTPATNQEITPSDIDALLYGRDLVVSGGDWVETVQGDLATIEGVSNAITALERRTISEGIPWDPSYGVKPNSYVDGPIGMLRELIGVTSRQMSADPRVLSSTTTVVLPDHDSGIDEAHLSSQVQFRGAPTTKQVDVQFPS